MVGFDDVPGAAYFIPPLTTVRPDFAAVARASRDMLMAQIESGRGRALRQTIMPTLIARQSVAEPRAGEPSSGCRVPHVSGHDDALRHRAR